MLGSDVGLSCGVLIAVASWAFERQRAVNPSEQRPFAARAWTKQLLRVPRMMASRCAGPESISLRESRVEL